MVENRNWRVISGSIKGAVHESKNEENQDSYKTVELGENKYIFALADGHGSNKCFRSEIGSELGVETATEVIKNNLEALWLDDKLNAKLIKKSIPQEMIASWKSAVDQKLRESPLTDDEISKLTTAERQVVDRNPYLVYGTTLIVTLFIDGHIICWQLGDGNILFVSEAKTSSMPMGKDEKMIANETYSMCMKNAAQYFNTKVFKDSDPMLRLIVVSSDGYANSFKSEEGFLKVGTDILEIIDKDGIEVAESELEGWLIETMASGSGDDITTGIFYRDNLTTTGEIDSEQREQEIEL